jgi:hypothetical protein
MRYFVHKGDPASSTFDTDMSEAEAAIIGPARRLLARLQPPSDVVGAYLRSTRLHLP